MEPIAHERAVDELAAHLSQVFGSSPDGVYVWLDEEHRRCNERFAALFGSASAAELRDTPGLLHRLVAEDDRGVSSWNYWHRVQPLAYPVAFRFTGVRKNGSTFPAQTDMVPLSYGGHTSAYHFVRGVA